MQLRNISRNELRAMMERGDAFTLVDVCPFPSYREYHLPGAVHVRLGPDFENQMRAILPSMERDVIVYGSAHYRQHPSAAARRLQRAGYCRVCTLADHKEYWHRLGWPVES